MASVRRSRFLSAVVNGYCYQGAPTLGAPSANKAQVVTPPLILLRLVGLALAFACSAVGTRAQPIDWANAFDGPGSVAPWYSGGEPAPLVSWDGALDACGATNSGSIRVVQPFTGGSNEYFFLIGSFVDASNNPAIVDNSYYTGVGFDLRVDPGTTPGTQGDFGPMAVETMATNGIRQPVATFRIPASATNWIRVSLRFPPTFTPQPLWAL